MASRMERYKKEEVSDSNTNNSSRSDKNKNLYEDFYTNAKYTEFTDINDRTVIELNNDNQDFVTRESYHKTKEFHDIMAPTVKREVIRENVVKEEKKVYDINQIMEEAKKNREEKDELDKKRKMRVSEYDILSDLSQEKLDKYKEQKKDSLRNDREDLEDLINTITSKSLRREIDEDLMSDLLPNGLEETIITESLSKDILEKYSSDMPQAEEEFDDIDHSFYTKSMDLSSEDFDIQDTSFVERKASYVVLKLILTIIALLILIIITIITLTR